MMEKKAFIVILAVILAIVFVSFGVRKVSLKKSSNRLEKINHNNMNALYKKGIEFYTEGDYEGTIRTYEAITKEFPDSKTAEDLLVNAATSYIAKRDYVNAQKVMNKFINDYPNSEKTSQIKNNLEKVNMEVLFSNIPTEDSISYQIKPGDTLGKIASQYNTTVELIKKANNLKSDIIIPGKYLKINIVKFLIVVDRSDNILTLKKENGNIVKTYIVSTGENLNTPLGDFKIEEKLISPLWYKVGAVVDPSSSDYELGTRWMGLSLEGYGIHGTKDESLIGKHITKGCVRMKNDEVEELYSIVPSGTEVIIVE
jgi:lipoprotein-anchoring transpeptidase ErfK/SrfK